MEAGNLEAGNLEAGNLEAGNMNKKNSKKLRRIDLARATGCNFETIRYYEKIGVMPEPPRSENGYRNYQPEHLERLGFVMRARDLGFSLAEVRELLTLVDGGMQTCAQVRNVAQKHLDDIEIRIDALVRVREVLSHTVARCSGKQIPDCAVIDALQPVFENV